MYIFCAIWLLLGASFLTGCDPEKQSVGEAAPFQDLAPEQTSPPPFTEVNESPAPVENKSSSNYEDPPSAEDEIVVDDEFAVETDENEEVGGF